MKGVKNGLWNKDRVQGEKDACQSVNQECKHSRLKKGAKQIEHAENLSAAAGRFLPNETVEALLAIAQTLIGADKEKQNNVNIIKHLQ